MKIAAAMTVRNEMHVLPINVAYHRSLGIDEFWICDNGSEDGTTDVLRALSEGRPWIKWLREPGPFRMSEIVTDLARQATKNGADWIIAIDADEFWSTPSGSLRDLIATGRAGALVCEVDNYVQASQVAYDHPASLTTMTYRAKKRGRLEDAKRLVESSEIAFVEMTYPPKLALRPTPSLVVGKGNHHATGFAGVERATTQMIVMHAPIRARDRLAHRAEGGRRTAAVHRDPITDWHLRRVAALEVEGDFEAEWVMNSYRRGALTVNGSPRPLVRDHRLRNAILPFVSRGARWSAPIRSRWKVGRAPTRGSEPPPPPVEIGDSREED